MATVEQNLQAIKNAVYGKDVRVAIHDSIESMNNKLNNSDPVAVAERLDNKIAPLAEANHYNIGYGIDSRLLYTANSSNPQSPSTMDCGLYISLGNNMIVYEDLRAIDNQKKDDKYTNWKELSNDNGKVYCRYNGSKYEMSSPQGIANLNHWFQVQIRWDQDYIKNNLIPKGIYNAYIGITFGADYDDIDNNVESFMRHNVKGYSKVNGNWNSLKCTNTLAVKLERVIKLSKSRMFVLYKADIRNLDALYRYLQLGYNYGFRNIKYVSVDFILDESQYMSIQNKVPGSDRRLLYGDVSTLDTYDIGCRSDTDDMMRYINHDVTIQDNGHLIFYSHTVDRARRLITLAISKDYCDAESKQRYLVLTNITFTRPQIFDYIELDTAYGTDGKKPTLVIGDNIGDWGAGDKIKYIVSEENGLLSNGLYRYVTQENGKHTLIIDLKKALEEYLLIHDELTTTLVLQFGHYFPFPTGSSSHNNNNEKIYYLECDIFTTNNYRLPYFSSDIIKLFDTEDKNEDKNEYENEIVCWGDSLTAGGGWMNVLSDRSGLPYVNCGVGGENANTIMARQGADAFVIKNITIPAANGSSVEIAKRSTDGGLNTAFGYKATPGLQGFGGMNPVTIDGFGDGKTITGNIQWTGSNYADMNGVWKFVRIGADPDGQATTIPNRPYALTTASDIDHNNPYLMIVFIGQNGGYNEWEDLVNKNRQMIEHARPKHYLVLGLSSGTAAERSEYESLMRKEFGRYFVSLREYLAHPICNSSNQIISCYGLEDQGLTPDSGTNAGGIAYNSLNDIAEGRVPRQILQDSVHYTNGTKNVIGNMLWRKCRELKIF